MNLLEQWNSSIKRDLIETLQSPDRPEGTFDFIFLDGFIRAYTCAPQMLSPFNWANQVFSSKPPNFSGKEDAGKFYNGLFAFYNYHLEQVMAGKCVLPIAHGYHPQSEKRTDIENWCAGFMLGFKLTEDHWMALANEYPQAQVALKASLQPLPQQIQSIVEHISIVMNSESALNQSSASQNLTEIFDSLPQKIELLGLIGQALLQTEQQNEDDEYAEIMAREEAELNDLTPITPQKTAKVGRNQTCPCGSGKKYKKCCLH